MFAILLISIAGTALLTGAANSAQTTDAVFEQAIALGLAQQLMDEIAGQRYMEPGGDPYGTLGPEAGELAVADRSQFDDIDDYAGYIEQPPADANGVALGTDDGQGGSRHTNFALPGNPLSRWRREVSVAYVSDSNPTTPLGIGTTSNFRRVTVRVLIDSPLGGSREVVMIDRLFSYVPPMD